jgi:GNAT superfamily N-acetyltransferase
MGTIRPPREEDAAPLSQLAERTFRDAFGASNAPADMDRHCSRFYAPQVQLAEIRDPQLDTLVVEHDGELVAYAQLRRREPPAGVHGSDPIELRRFYVLQRWHGTGLAADLMQAVLTRAAERGADVLWLGVWEHNPRAIRFYRRWGFREVGEQPFVLGSDPQRDLVMATEVAAAAAQRAPAGPSAS